MPRIFGTSIPKSGTHLFEAMFKEIGYSTERCPKILGDIVPRESASRFIEDLYVFGHWRSSPSMAGWLLDNDFKTLVILRDPRDICISLAEFIRSGRPKSLRTSQPELMTMPINDLIARLIVGHRYPSYVMPGARRMCDGWLQWTDHGASLIRYESIASGDVDFEEIARLGIDPDAFSRAAVRCFGRKNAVDDDTLNVGRAGRWRMMFDDELVDVWNQAAYGVATSLGYEECG